MLKGLSDATVKYPTSFGIWAEMIQKLILGINELVIAGEGYDGLLTELLGIFMPHRVLQVSAYSNDSFPLLTGKSFSNRPVIFLCKNYACQAPVTNVDSLVRLLENFHVYS